MSRRIRVAYILNLVRNLTEHTDGGESASGAFLKFSS